VTANRPGASTTTPSLPSRSTPPQRCRQSSSPRRQSSNSSSGHFLAFNFEPCTYMDSKLLNLFDSR
jgi:hypothetical protein